MERINLAQIYRSVCTGIGVYDVIFFLFFRKLILKYFYFVQNNKKCSLPVGGRQESVNGITSLKFSSLSYNYMYSKNSFFTFNSTYPAYPAY